MKKYIFSIVVAIGIVGCGGSLGINSPSNSSSSNSSQSNSQATSSSGLENARAIGKDTRDRLNSKVSQKQAQTLLDAQNRQSKMPNDGPHIPPIPRL